MVVGYYAEWARTTDYYLTSIPSNKFDMVLYAFLYMQPTFEDYLKYDGIYKITYKSENPVGTVISNDPYYFDLNMKDVPKFRQSNPNTKLLISLGGWNYCWNMSNIAANDEYVSNMVYSLKWILDKYQLDGVDLDWEFVGTKGAYFSINRPEDPENMCKMVRKMKQVLGSKYIITAALGIEQKNLQAFVKCEELFDLFLLMTYDFAGEWSLSGHQSCMYNNKLFSDINVDLTYNYFIKYVNKNKVIIGTPFYGYGFGSIYVEDNIYQSTKPSKAKSLSGWIEPKTAYQDLVNLDGKNGYRLYFDRKAKASYLKNDSMQTLWTFDDKYSLYYKLIFIKKLNVRGIFAWELSNDYHQDSLISCILKEFSGQNCMKVFDCSVVSTTDSIQKQKYCCNIKDKCFDCNQASKGTYCCNQNNQCFIQYKDVYYSSKSITEYKFNYQIKCINPEWTQKVYYANQCCCFKGLNYIAKWYTTRQPQYGYKEWKIIGDNCSLYSEPPIVYCSNQFFVKGDCCIYQNKIYKALYYEFFTNNLKGFKLVPTC